MVGVSYERQKWKLNVTNNIHKELQNTRDIQRTRIQHLLTAKHYIPLRILTSSSIHALIHPFMYSSFIGIRQNQN